MHRVPLPFRDLNALGVIDAEVRPKGASEGAPEVPMRTVPSSTSWAMRTLCGPA
jgi:hypothetical protein